MKGYLERLSLIFFYLLLLSQFSQSFAQISVVVKEIPNTTPEGDTLYIVGSFNDWNPSDHNYMLTKQPDNTYHIRLPFRGDFEYKFSRGDWDSVEGSFSGEAIDNRVFRVEFSESDTIFASIISWEDKPIHVRKVFDTLRFIIDEAPDNTPKDASVYIVGSFNNWHPGSPKFRAVKKSDGKFYVDVPLWEDTIQYKFTRGDFFSIEGRRNGRARRDREYIYDPNNKELHVTIASWEDLSGGLTAYAFILILAATQGFLLILAINHLQNNNKSANRLLSILITLISLALLARVSTVPRDVFQTFPKLLLLPDLLIYFIYGPVFFFYIQKLLTIPPKSVKKRWMHFIPASIHFISYLPLAFLPHQVFIDRVVREEIHIAFIISGGFALLFNAYYWFRCFKLVKYYQKNSVDNHSFDENIQYLNTVLALKAIVLLIWLSTCIIYATGLFSKFKTIELTETSTDIIWLVFSSITYCLGYFAITQPEVFKQIAPEDIETAPPSEEKTERHTMPNEELSLLKRQLMELMNNEKPYLNAQLTLAELAEKASMTSHNLSRVINEGFSRNFYDFVNSYRVEAFKKEIEQKQHMQKTLLAIAYEVGFNSKSSFNRSFNKLTNMSPSKYLKMVESGEEMPSLLPTQS